MKKRGPDSQSPLQATEKKPQMCFGSKIEKETKGQAVASPTDQHRALDGEELCGSQLLSAGASWGYAR